MKDRFGHSVLVGWSDHHIIWILAAMSLPHKERIAAFQDIADLTGRGYGSVYDKSQHLLRLQEIERRARARSQTQAEAETTIATTTISAPTREMLMGSGRRIARTATVST